jgi:hypothetical protein
MEHRGAFWKPVAGIRVLIRVSIGQPKFSPGPSTIPSTVRLRRSYRGASIFVPRFNTSVGIGPIA